MKIEIAMQPEGTFVVYEDGFKAAEVPSQAAVRDWLQRRAWDAESRVTQLLAEADEASEEVDAYRTALESIEGRRRVAGPGRASRARLAVPRRTHMGFDSPPPTRWHGRPAR